MVTILMGFAGTICAQDDVMFNYQGRVKVQGNLFTGTGQFKFVITNNAGNESLWSNDNSSSGGAVPTASLSLSVSDGIFNAMIGDTSLGMAPINRSIFNNSDNINLRIWFSDGTHGFQQLLPDHKLVNVDLLGMITSSTDFTIYVNGSTGNDAHNGLSPSKAKKTIQAAVDVLPERLKCNVTIDIADGIYREKVNVYGITAHPEKKLTFQGDDVWTPASVGDPSVRITGNDDDVSSKRVRDYAVCARDCSRVYFKGIMFDSASYCGLGMYEGSYGVNNCKIWDNVTGVSVGEISMAVFADTFANDNDYVGIYVSTNSRGDFTNCKSTYNGNAGIVLNSMCMGSFFGTGDFSNNAGAGINNVHHSKLNFNSYTGQINNNGDYGIQIHYDSYSTGHTLNTFSGNTNGNVLTANGGHTY